MSLFLKRPLASASALSLTLAGALAGVLAGPTSAQASQAPSAPPSSGQASPDPSAIAPKPTSAQFAAFLSAFDHCTLEDGTRLSAAKKQEIRDVTAQAEKDMAALKPFQRTEFMEYATYPLLGALPQMASNYDKLSLEDAKALEQRTGISRLDPPIHCPFNPAAFPVLHWLADRDETAREDRALANAILGMLALQGASEYRPEYRPEQQPQLQAEYRPDPMSAAEARAYFLKATLFAHGQLNFPLKPAKFWSDGQDNDILANIKRQGLQPYFDRAMAGQSGYFIRLFQAEMFAQSNPVATRQLLMSDNPYDPLILLNLERKGLISASDTENDLAYWRNLVQRSTPLYLARHGSDLWEKIASIAMRLNEFTISVSAARPTVAQAYVPQGRRSPKGFDPAKLPVSMRALIAPDGSALFIVPCNDKNGDLDADPMEDRVRFAEFAQKARANLKPLTPLMVEGRKVYSWVVLPGTAPAETTRDCTAHPLLNKYAVPPPEPAPIRPE